MVKLDVEKAEGPHDFSLNGGPFDGSSIRLGVGILEAHPAAIVIECDSKESRGKTRERYVFGHEEGEPAYYHQQS